MKRKIVYFITVVIGFAICMVGVIFGSRLVFQRICERRTTPWSDLGTADDDEYRILIDAYKIKNQSNETVMIQAFDNTKLIGHYADGVLRRDAYIEKKKALSEKLAALQDSIRTEKEEQECADELDEEIRALTKQASEKTYIGGLTKECVDAFVSMVYLYDDQTMKIEFNCEDVIRRALEKYGA